LLKGHTSRAGTCGMHPGTTHHSHLTTLPPPVLQDPAVMAATLAGLQMLVRQDPKPYRNLVPSFVSILKQVGGSAVQGRPARAVAGALLPCWCSAHPPAAAVAGGTMADG
jgi:hypothetical protein